MSTQVHLAKLVEAALWECCGSEAARCITQAGLLDGVLESCLEDAFAFSEKDPASCRDIDLIINSYTSFKAVLHYRLARAILQSSQSISSACMRRDSALLVSSRGKMLSGAEIHPRARIGRRFILDHGVGTVVGETCAIGNDCYILGGVVLGATGIAANPAIKRHPTIGNRVQIGAFARVFGPVEVGDNSFIGAHAVITSDLPANSVVTVRSVQQITKILPRDGSQEALIADFTVSRGNS